MITYPLTFPTFTGAARLTPTTRQVVGQSTSPFTAEQHQYVYSAKWWEHAVQLPPLFGEEGEAMVAFLVSLNGVEGTFTMRDFSYRAARGSLLGTPVVSGAGQSGSSLVTSGWTAGITGQMLPGDEFQLGSGETARLYKVVSRADSNGSGIATLEIWPSLRGSPANAAALVLTSPVGIWRLTANDFSWSVNPGEEYDINFTAREAL